MDAFNFNFIVLPLGIIVFILAATVFYYAKKEEFAKRRALKIIRLYVNETKKQHKHHSDDIAHLNLLLKEKSIDKETYNRMKKLLEMSYEQKREDARIKVGNDKNEQ